MTVFGKILNTDVTVFGSNCKSHTSPHQCANIGPADYNYDETISTLRYANRAKNIKNKARINEDPKDALLRKYQKEIEDLKKKLEEGKKKLHLVKVELKFCYSIYFTLMVIWLCALDGI